MAALGQLVVSLTAETAQFRQSMDRAAYQSQKNFQDITSAAKMAGAAIAAFVSVRGIASAIKEQIDYADQLAKTAQKIGITTEELSKLNYAAKLSGVESGSLQGALSRLVKGMSDASQGTGEASKGFQALGINIKNSDGSLKSSTTILTEVAAKFRGLEDGTQKTALAIQLFGKSGADLIPLLNSGADGIKEMGDELERLGGVISGDFAAQSERFNDNIERLGILAKSTSMVIADELLPTINRFLETILAVNQVSKGEGKGFWATLLGLTEIGEFLGYGIGDKVVAELKKIDEARSSANKGPNKPTTTVNVVDEKAQKEEEKRQKSITDIIARQESQYRSLVFTKGEMLAQDLETLGATQQQIDFLNALNNEIERETSLREAQKEATDQAVARAEAYKNLVAETSTPVQILAEREAELLRLRRELIDNGYSVEEVEKRIAAAREKGQMDLMVQQQAARESLYSGLLTEEEAVMQSFANRKAAILTATEITELERQDLMRRLEEQFQKEQQERQNATVSGILQGGEQLFNGLAGFAKAAGGESSKAYRIMFAASKAFAIADATIKLQQAIANASVSAPFPANLGAMAAIAAQVSGLISTISSTNYSGAYDKGGYIPYGKWGIVGEYGPEMVQGPANVTSRKDTAEMMGRAPELNIKNINVLDPTIVGDYLNTAQGERIILNVIQRNRGALA
jgi:hypothetical protein